MTNDSIDQLVGIALPTLRDLRAAVLVAGDQGEAVAALRQAGFVGGNAVYGAFQRWLTETAGPSGSAESADPGDLTISDFSARAAQFFGDAGWGEMQFVEDEADGVALVEIANCWEGDRDDGIPGCHVTTGLLASFFGRLAGYPVAVLETGCCEGEERRCRFMLGNAEMMNYKWEELGGAYRESSASSASE